MPGVDPSASARPNLGFSVGHQKVELEIDLATKSLKGTTEITIHPRHRDLTTIWLNFRQGDIKRVSVNGKVATYRYADPYEALHLYGAQYHERLTQHIDGLLQTPSTPTLPITIPKNVRIDELDPSSAEAQDQIALQSTGDDVDGPPGGRAPEVNLPQFTSLTVHIEFGINKIRDGLQFVGVENGDRRYPHAYTTNSLESGIGCPLFPCVDDTASRCTWEISITCPSSLGDVFDRKSQDVSGPTSSRSKGQTRQLSSDDEGLDMSVVLSLIHI